MAAARKLSASSRTAYLRMPRVSARPTGDLRKRIAIEVRLRLRGREISNRQLGKLLGVSESQIRKRHRAELAWPTDWLAAIDSAFGTTLVPMVYALGKQGGA